MKKSSSIILRIVLYLALFLMLFVVFLACLAGHQSWAVILAHMPLGWWHFLERNASLMTWNWTLIATGVLTSVAVVGLGHYFLGTLFRHLQTSRTPEAPENKWRWRWTLSVYASIWLLFTILFGATGVYRHGTWLNDYGEPWYEERLYPPFEFMRVEQVIENLLLKTDGDLEKTYRAYLAEKTRRKNSFLHEDFKVLFFANSNRVVQHYLIIPRMPQLVKREKFYDQGHTNLIRNMRELSPAIETYSAQYPFQR